MSEVQGLSHAEALRRLKTYGSNLLRPKKKTTSLALLASQFTSPLVLLLLFAASISLFFYDSLDAAIILTIVIFSAVLGFIQERKAVTAVEKMLAIVQVKATVIRDGIPTTIAMEKIVPGDLILFKSGDRIPADCAIIESKGFFTNEASLTGESQPIEKNAGDRVFMGTYVMTGSGKAVVEKTGKQTKFGEISSHLKEYPPPTAFEMGIRRFGYFLMVVTLILVTFVFLVNLYLDRPILTSFLFALALAVGLTPQLLPAIISVNLAHGAKHMSHKKVIVKRLASIENFGSMNILCADKTGTLTEGTVVLEKALDVKGEESKEVLLYAALNAHFQKAYVNPIDEALSKVKVDMTGWSKIDEIPYDFQRKCLSILVEKEGKRTLIVKGAFRSILEMAKGDKGLLEKKFEEFSSAGYRTIAIATAPFTKNRIQKGDEKGVEFLGFLLFTDPLKPEIKRAMERLKARGVELKIITGDHQLVVKHIAEILQFEEGSIALGKDIASMSESEVEKTRIFAEVEPNQKEEIILKLRNRGNIVGYLGDGINDVTALHAADVSISVNTGAEVAKDVADIVLLHKDLQVLLDGIEEGRRTFANTLKYIFMATSANFGNMFSVAGASLFLNFLPLLPKQILLTNLMTDFPEMSIATDNVDREWIERPVSWNIKFIGRFMVVFGLISSFFDFLTFGVLLFILKADVDQFRTGWFIESVVSAAAIVLVIRTMKSCFKSYPSKTLAISVITVIGITLFIPYFSYSSILGFTKLPSGFISMMLVIVGLYITTVEIAKKWFLRNNTLLFKRAEVANGHRTSKKSI